MSSSFKTGIVVYSRSGHSLRIAQKLAKALDGTVIELVAPKYGGAVGYVRAGYHSLKQTCTLAQQSFDFLTEYDRIILCGPVWTSYPATPLRGLLLSGKLSQPVSLFLTNGDHSPAQKAFDIGAADFGRPFVATASLANAFEETEQEDRIFKKFLNDLANPHRELEMAQFDASEKQ